MTHSITFHTAEDKIIITFEDATTQEYIKSDKDQYLIDFPDRFADVEAMGWHSTLDELKALEVTPPVAEVIEASPVVEEVIEVTP